jgi:hypothetical protein
VGVAVVANVEMAVGLQVLEVVEVELWWLVIILRILCPSMGLEEILS